MHTPNLVKVCQFILNILSRNEILTLIKGHNFVNKLQKVMCNNTNLDLVNINVYTKIGKILSICPQDIEWKQNSDNNQGQ